MSRIRERWPEFVEDVRKLWSPDKPKAKGSLAEPAGSVTDTQRLDWLCKWWPSQEDAPFFSVGPLENPTGSFRDAIDRAMSRSPNEKGQR